MLSRNILGRDTEDKPQFMIASELLSQNKCPHGHGYLVFLSLHHRKCVVCPYEDKSDVPYSISYRFAIEFPSEKNIDSACIVVAFAKSGERAYTLNFANLVDAQEYVGLMSGTIKMSRIPNEAVVRMRPSIQTAFSLGTFKELLHIPADWDIADIKISWTTGSVRLALFNPQEIHLDGERLPFYSAQIRRRADGVIVCDGWKKT